MEIQRFKNNAKNKQKLEPEQRKQYFCYPFTNGRTVLIHCVRDKMQLLHYETSFHNYVFKFPLEKFHFIGNTQLGAHIIFQTEKQAESFK